MGNADNQKSAVIIKLQRFYNKVKNELFRYRKFTAV